MHQCVCDIINFPYLWWHTSSCKIIPLRRFDKKKTRKKNALKERRKEGGMESLNNSYVPQVFVKITIILNFYCLGSQLQACFVQIWKNVYENGPWTDLPQYFDRCPFSLITCRILLGKLLYRLWKYSGETSVQRDKTCSKGSLLEFILHMLLDSFLLIGCYTFSIMFKSGY